ncbi:MAG: pantetheine-phosphate adenylyltransferase, partial [candidate division Zixibacteria bacterium]|nr:pantetheine-phosphate adenylyltransferase [candidate division Zixibacteria bacterium]
MPLAKTKTKKSSRKKKRIAIYPGTFDPITNGHMSLITRTCGLFDGLVVAVAKNAGKSPMFGHAERFKLVKKSTEHLKKVEVIKFDCLLANLARKMGACSIIRGLRAVSDFEYEFQMALMNRRMAREIET